MGFLDDVEKDLSSFDRLLQDEWCLKPFNSAIPKDSIQKKSIFDFILSSWSCINVPENTLMYWFIERMVLVLVFTTF